VTAGVAQTDFCALSVAPYRTNWNKNIVRFRKCMPLIGLHGQPSTRLAPEARLCARFCPRAPDPRAQTTKRFAHGNTTKPTGKRLVKAKVCLSLSAPHPVGSADYPPRSGEGRKSLCLFTPSPLRGGGREGGVIVPLPKSMEAPESPAPDHTFGGRVGQDDPGPHAQPRPCRARAVFWFS
jgi:hypothetical protein